MKNMFRNAVLAAALLASTSALAQEPKPAGDASPIMAIDTPTFLSQTMSSNQFEIRSSKLAQEKSEGDGIKELAEMIIADHTKAGEKLEATLEAEGSTPSAEAALAPKHAKMVSQLEVASGADFDTLYIDMQAQAHMEAVALFRTYAGAGEDQALVGFAKETLPALETHLGHVKELVAAQ